MNTDNKLSKIVFIVPYYGKIPKYFAAWLLSVEYNPTINFILVTDIKLNQTLPENVTVLRWTWKELVNKIQEPFGFKINVKTPYNLCDFRPAYGLIFKDYIKEYDFWGNCDIDQVFGDIRRFITEDILKNNDIIGYLGHFSLRRNIPEINEIFKLSGSLFDYKTVFSTDEWYAFDEYTGIKQIVEKNNISHYFNNKYIADASIIHNQMKAGKLNYKHQVFYWENGKVYRAYIVDNKIHRQEYMYLHFQKKNPVPRFNISKSTKAFYIFSDAFVEKKLGMPEMKNIINNSHWRGRGYEAYEVIKYYGNKLKTFVTLSKAQRSVWIKQRRYRRKTIITGEKWD